MGNTRTRKPKAAADTAPPARAFQLASSEGADYVVRVAIGASPRVSIGTGQVFETTDPRLAARLAAAPELEEVTR